VRRLSLKSNFAFALAGNAFYQACQWGMLVALTKLTTPEDVGRFALALAISTPVVTLAALNLRAVQVTDAQGQNTFGQFLALRLFTVLFAILTILAIAVVSGYPLETALIIVLVGLSQCTAITREVFQSFMQKHERMDKVAVSQIIAGALSLVALAHLLWATGSLLAAVAAMTGSRVFTLLSWDIHVVRRMAGAMAGDLFRFDWNLGRLSKLAWLALPAGIMSVLTRLVEVVPQYFIEAQLGTEMLGFFAAIAALPMAGRMIVNASGMATLPRLSRLFAQRNHRFTHLTLKLIAVSTALGIAGLAATLIFGQWLLTVIFTAEYAAYQRLFVWLMLYGGVAYIAGAIGYSLHATRWFWSLPALYTAVAGTCVIGCLLLVPRFGIEGAAFAMIFARATQIPLSLCIVTWAYRRRAD